MDSPPPDGEEFEVRLVIDFQFGVTGTLVLADKLPDASSIRLQGAYAMMREDSLYEVKGDAVIRVNGTEILRLDPGGRPYQRHSFDVDLTHFAGRDVLIELVSDGRLTAPAGADWFDPRIMVD